MNAESLAVEWAGAHATVLVLPDEAAALARARDGAGRAEGRLAEARRRAGELPEVAEAARLAGLLASTRAEQSRAEASHREAAAAARQALERGDDPAGHEQAATEAGDRAVRLAARLAHLGPLSGAAAAAAERKGRALVARERATLSDELAGRRAGLLHELHGAMTPALTELLAVDLVLTSLGAPEPPLDNGGGPNLPPTGAPPGAPSSRPADNPPRPAPDDAGPAADNANATRPGLCAAWLKATLTREPMRLSAVRARAEEEGHTARSLYAARELLGVVESEGPDGKKLWALPADSPAGV
jgi:hypothetical protein